MCYIYSTLTNIVLHVVAHSKCASPIVAHSKCATSRSSTTCGKNEFHPTSSQLFFYYNIILWY